MDLKAHESLSWNWVSCELMASWVSDYILHILKDMSVLGFEVNTATFTAGWQLCLSHSEGKRFSRARSQHLGWVVSRVRQVSLRPVLGQKCTWPQEHLLLMLTNPIGGFLTHTVVASHATVAKCLAEASTRG